jgi:hypothetical protein
MTLVTSFFRPFSCFLASWRPRKLFKTGIYCTRYMGTAIAAIWNITANGAGSEFKCPPSHDHIHYLFLLFSGIIFNCFVYLFSTLVRHTPVCHTVLDLFLKRYSPSIRHVVFVMPASYHVCRFIPASTSSDCRGGWLPIRPTNNQVNYSSLGGSHVFLIDILLLCISTSSTCSCCT